LFLIFSIESSVNSLFFTVKSEKTFRLYKWVLGIAKVVLLYIFEIKLTKTRSMNHLQLLLLFLALSGCSLFEKEEVVPEPIAEFSAKETDFSEVEVTNLSLNSDQYFVDWGDGQTSESTLSLSSKVSHTYGDNKSYTIILRAISKDGLKSTFKSVDITTKTARGNGIFYATAKIGQAVDIYVDGQFKGTVSMYAVSGTPDCGTSGFVTVAMPVGTYKAVGKIPAYDITVSLGTITILNAKCIKKPFT
jgi:hypothetical protein